MNINSLLVKPTKKKLILHNNRKEMLSKIPPIEARQQSLMKIFFKKNVTQAKQLLQKSHDFYSQGKKKPSPQSKDCQKQKRSRKIIILKQQKFTQTLRTKFKIQRSNSPARLRSLSLNHKKTESDNPINTNVKDVKPTFSYQVTEIYHILMESYIIQSKTPVCFWMKKDNFAQLLNSLLTLATLNQRDEQIEEIELRCLKNKFHQLRKKVRDLQFQKRVETLKITNQIINLKIDNKAYYKQLDYLHQSIITLKDQKQLLQQTIKSKKEQLHAILKLCQQKRQATLDYQRNYFQLTQSFSAQTQQLKRVKIQLADKQQLLKKAAVKAEQLLNYVEKQEEKKILHWVSEAYKQIQSEIYDYATYLQCNAMASSLTWEPKPFRAVEKWVYEQMERVNKFILSEAQSLKDKSAKMANFITNTTRKFRTKDEQMMKITDYKTECIKKFIKMMQKWLQNWELKQEYLVGLRTQFALQAQQVNRIFQDVLVEAGNNKELDASKLKQSNKRLRELWQSVELNYKYGNSFY